MLSLSLYAGNDSAEDKEFLEFDDDRDREAKFARRDDNE